MRRTKQDKNIARSLPDKQEQKNISADSGTSFTLPGASSRNASRNREKTGFERKGIILQTLNKLKLLCNHPALYLKESATKQTVRRSHKSEKLLNS
ncbi:hypothetical protein AAAC51_12695 [Priestia megaterium]